ncbi:MAG: tape measure protein [Oscillospiraceae bacterium]|jgi:hypothetical protein|nr:tape measure protein [Oscillospiraceae bacterium]
MRKGKADAQDWNSLLVTMGPALGEMAKSFGMSTDQLKDALREGEISIDQFTGKLVELSVAEGGFADRAKEMTGGVATAFTNAKTAVVRGVTELIGAVDRGASSFGGIQGSIEKAGTATAKFISGAGNLIEAIIPIAPAALTATAAIAALTLTSHGLTKFLANAHTFENAILEMQNFATLSAKAADGTKLLTAAERIENAEKLKSAAATAALNVETTKLSLTKAKETAAATINSALIKKETADKALLAAQIQKTNVDKTLEIALSQQNVNQKTVESLLTKKISADKALEAAAIKALNAEKAVEIAETAGVTGVKTAETAVTAALTNAEMAENAARGAGVPLKQADLSITGLLTAAKGKLLSVITSEVGVLGAAGIAAAGLGFGIKAIGDVYWKAQDAITEKTYALTEDTKEMQAATVTANEMLRTTRNLIDSGAGYTEILNNSITVQQEAEKASERAKLAVQAQDKAVEGLNEEYKKNREFVEKNKPKWYDWLSPGAALGKTLNKDFKEAQEAVAGVENVFHNATVSMNEAEKAEIAYAQAQKEATMALAEYSGTTVEHIEEIREKQKQFTEEYEMRIQAQEQAQIEAATKMGKSLEEYQNQLKETEKAVESFTDNIINDFKKMELGTAQPMNEVISNLKFNAEASLEFADNAERLRELGVSQTFIQQLGESKDGMAQAAQAVKEWGDETAESKAQIAELNDVFRLIPEAALATAKALNPDTFVPPIESMGENAKTALETEMSAVEETAVSAVSDGAASGIAEIGENLMSALDGLATAGELANAEQMGKDIISNVASGIEDSSEIQTALQSSVDAAKNGIDPSSAETLGGDILNQISAGLTNNAENLTSAFQSAMATGAASGIAAAGGDISNAAQTEIGGSVTEGIIASQGEIQTASQTAIGGGTAEGIDAGTPQVLAAVKNMINQGVAVVAASVSQFTAAAMQCAAGAAQGIRNGIPAYAAACRDMAIAGNSAFNSANEIKSPSRLYERSAKFNILGAVAGVVKNSGFYANSLKEMAIEGNCAFRENVEKFQFNAVEIPDIYKDNGGYSYGSRNLLKTSELSSATHTENTVKSEKLDRMITLLERLADAITEAGNRPVNIGMSQFDEGLAFEGSMKARA